MSGIKNAKLGLKWIPGKGYHFADGAYVEYLLDDNSVKVDMKKAVKLWRVPASHGHASAQYGLSVALRVLSVDPNETAEESFHYAKLAAEQGLREAEYNVGVSLSKGLGVAVDVDEAKPWLERAAAKGFQPAIDLLPQLAKLAAHPKES